MAHTPGCPRAQHTLPADPLPPLLVCIGGKKETGLQLLPSQSAFCKQTGCDFLLFSREPGPKGNTPAGECLARGTFVPTRSPAASSQWR